MIEIVMFVALVIVAAFVAFVIGFRTSRKEVYELHRELQHCCPGGINFYRAFYSDGTVKEMDDWGQVYAIHRPDGSVSRWTDNQPII